jgi:hypothetical protein
MFDLWPSVESQTMTTPNPDDEFDYHTAETESTNRYGEGGWLSDKGVAFVDGARWGFAQAKEKDRLRILVLQKNISDLEAGNIYLARENERISSNKLGTAVLERESFARESNDLRKELEAANASLSKAQADLQSARERIGKLRAANEKIAPWLSASLEDYRVCKEMKADVNFWFDAITADDAEAGGEG